MSIPSRRYPRWIWRRASMISSTNQPRARIRTLLQSIRVAIQLALKILNPNRHSHRYGRSSSRGSFVFHCHSLGSFIDTLSTAFPTDGGTGSADSSADGQPAGLSSSPLQTIVDSNGPLETEHCRALPAGESRSGAVAGRQRAERPVGGSESEQSVGFSFVR